MGEEADRLIEQAMYYSVEGTLAGRSKYRGVAPASAVTKGVVVKKDIGRHALWIVRMVPIGGVSESLYYCKAGGSLKVGEAVYVDSDYVAYPCSTINHPDCPTNHADERLDALFERLDEESNEHPLTQTTTTVTCSYCQAKGLHWSGKKGVNLHLRDEHGFVHDCGRSKVTINL